MMINNIVEYLDALIPNPKCELNYTKDYELLIAVMLSAQTTDKRVNEVTSVLFNQYKSLKSLSMADVNKIMDIIHPLGTYHRKSINVIAIAEKLVDIGFVPNDRIFLESMPGVGRKTANVVLSELYQVPCIAVDTHVARVSIRLGLANDKDDVLTIEKKLTKKLKQYNLNKLHHQLLLFGRYYCKAIKPECKTCKLKEICRYIKK